MSYNIAVINNKGGCGKTTCSSYIANALADKQYKVLLIDTDPQGNLSRVFGVEPNEDIENDNTLADAINNKLGRKNLPVTNFIKSTNHVNIDIMSGNQRLTDARTDLEKALMRGIHVYKRILADISNDCNYDFIIFDTCPSLGGENTQVLFAVDYVIIPTSDDINSIQGMDKLIDFYKDCLETNDKLQVLGILINNVDAKDRTTQEVINVLKSTYDDVVFDTVIEKSKVAAKIALYGVKTVKNKSYESFALVVDEMLRKINGKY